VNFEDTGLPDMTRTDKQKNASRISASREDGFPKTQNRAIYVLVHGAWHGSWCWKRVRKGLRDAGHEVFTPTLTGLGERSHLNAATVDLSTHIADVVNLLRWEDLSDVILCGHSYGGSVIRAVADRVPERICTLVYLDAFVPEDGQSLLDLHAPEHAQHMRLQAKTAGAGWNVPPIPAERFNVNPRDAAWVNAQCTPQSIASFEERIKLNREPFRPDNTAFVLATEWDDSPFRAAHERAKAKGWQTRTVPCGHEVMLDLPGELTHLLLEFETSAVPSSHKSLHEDNIHVAQ
jgi:pimeloyl-ACP methyl ester carboxylesterase